MYDKNMDTRVDKSSKKIEKMFDDISPIYDMMNNLISLNTHKIIKKSALKRLKIKNNAKILDLCCGSGDLAFLIQEMYPDCEIIGVDFSTKMLEIAQEKNIKEKIKFINANAQNLPFEDNSFDYIVSSFGLRNVHHIDKVIFEIKRILKEKGQFLHIDFGEKNFFNKIFDLIVSIFGKIFYKYSEHYDYLIKSKKEFYLPQNLINKFNESNLKLKTRKDYVFSVISSQVFEK